MRKSIKEEISRVKELMFGTQPESIIEDTSKNIEEDTNVDGLSDEGKTLPCIRTLANPILDPRLQCNTKRIRSALGDIFSVITALTYLPF